MSNEYVALEDYKRALTPDHLDQQRKWSDKTFGPGRRTKGVVAHIAKELEEVLESGGSDLTEWVDVMILAVDGATRAGYSGDQVLATYRAKMHENYKREWPDWRGFSEDEPIEHVRTA